MGVLLLPFLLPGGLAQQGPVWLRKMHGGSTPREIRSCIADKSGNVYINGFISGSSGLQGIFLEKFTGNGELIWSRYMHWYPVSMSEEMLAELSIDSGGNVIFSGHFQAIDLNPGPPVQLINVYNFGGAFVMKLNPAGDLMWAHAFYALGTAYGSAYFNLAMAAADPDDNVILCGRFEGSADFDPGPDTCIRSSSGTKEDIFILKLNPQGHFVFVEVFGKHDKYEVPLDIETSVHGDILLTGQYEHTGGQFHDIFIWKFDKGGSLKWHHEIGCPSYEGAWDIAADHSGNVYVTGMVHDTADFDPGPGTYSMSSHSPYFLAKYHAGGTLLWAKPLGFRIMGMSLAPNGNLLIAAYGSGLDWDPGNGETYFSEGGYYVLETDTAANLTCATRIFDTGSQSPPVADAAGSVFYAGNKYDENIYYLSKSMQCHLLDIDEAMPCAGFRVFPNPSSGICHVQSDADDFCILTSVSGSAAQTHRVNAGLNTIDVSGLASGVYIVTLKERRQSHFRLVLNHSSN